MKHIYAAGDCIGGPQFTHFAGFQAADSVSQVALLLILILQASFGAFNALFPVNLKAAPAINPAVTFTDPEVVH